MRPKATLLFYISELIQFENDLHLPHLDLLELSCCFDISYMLS